MKDDFHESSEIKDFVGKKLPFAREILMHHPAGAAGSSAAAGGGGVPTCGPAQVLAHRFDVESGEYAGAQRRWDIEAPSRRR
jgi:hypothetical protein